MLKHAGLIKVGSVQVTLYAYDLTVNGEGEANKIYSIIISQISTEKLGKLQKVNSD